MVGVSETEGVRVMVGVSVIVGVRLMVGVGVMVEVRVEVMVGGKKRYAIGSAKRLVKIARMMNTTDNNNILQPVTMRSRRIRKNLRVRALRIERVPTNIPYAASTERRATKVTTPV